MLNISLSNVMKKIVAYYRVSTKRQGASGLGLAAQRETVLSYASNNNADVIREYTETESGKNDDRIELKKAIDFCKSNDATLVIAKLDRLSRNASFIFHLRDSQVNFVCCDIPDANTLTIGIFAIIAQHEREMISSRIKAALSVKKQQGFTLGTPTNLTDAARSQSIEIRKNKARSNSNNKRAFAFIKSERKQGTSYSKIANLLNDNGFKTATNKDFKAMTVKRIENIFNS